MRSLGELQSMRSRTEVRGDHRIFMDRASTQLAASVVESNRMLHSLTGPREAPVPPTAGRSSARALFAALQASPGGLAQLPVRESEGRSPKDSPRTVTVKESERTRWRHRWCSIYIVIRCAYSSSWRCLRLKRAQNRGVFDVFRAFLDAKRAHKLRFPHAARTFREGHRL